MEALVHLSSTLFCYINLIGPVTPTAERGTLQRNALLTAACIRSLGTKERIWHLFVTSTIAFGTLYKEKRISMISNRWEAAPCSQPGRTICATQRVCDAGDNAAAGPTPRWGHGADRWDDLRASASCPSHSLFPAVRMHCKKQASRHASNRVFRVAESAVQQLSHYQMLRQQEAFYRRRSKSVSLVRKVGRIHSWRATGHQWSRFVYVTLKAIEEPIIGLLHWWTEDSGDL